MSTWFEEQLAGRPVMAILRGFGVGRTVELARTAWDVGISCVEVPVQSAEDLEALRATVAAGAEQGRPVGAGTIVSADLLRTVVDAGAAFTVAPGLDEEVVRASADLGVAHLPGVATATEVHTALRWGLTWLKAFPAAQLGPGWVRAMHGPFPTARFVTTGGIDAHNAQDFLDAGAQVVAVGSALGDASQLELLGQLVSRVEGRTTGS